MMQQNLVSGETKLADYWLLLFKITSVQGLCQKKLRQMVVCLIPDGSRMVPRYLMAPDSTSLLGTDLEKAYLWLTYMYICHILHHLVHTNMNWLSYWLIKDCLLHRSTVSSPLYTVG
jgi:hypothetical protein